MSMGTNQPSGPRPADGHPGVGVPPESAQAGYERRDADVGALLKFALGLFLTLVAVFLVSWWAFDYYAKSQKLGPPVSPFESGNVRVLPPEPRLQVTPRLDLADYCEAQREALTTYAWLDQERSIGRIPIDLAMKKLLERGLPVRAGSHPPESSAVQQESAAPDKASAGLEFGPCGYVLETQAAQQPGHGRD